MLCSTISTNTATTPGKNMRFFYAIKDQKCEKGDNLGCLKKNQMQVCNQRVVKKTFNFVLHISFHNTANFYTQGGKKLS